MNLKIGMKYWRKKPQSHPLSNNTGHSTSTLLRSGSEPNDRAMREHKFYQQFLHRNKLLEVKITGYSTIGPATLTQSSYVNYSIQIMTDHINVVRENRYSEFLEMYRKVNKVHTLRSQFPPKTHIHSKISEDLSEQRKNLLNQILQQIIRIPPEHELALIEFLKFLRIKQQFEKRDIMDDFLSFETARTRKNSDLSIQGKLTKSYCIAHEMSKFNSRKHHSDQILSKLSDIIINAKKVQIKIDDLKLVLLGNHEVKGLLSLAFKCEEETKSSQIMTVILNLLSSEKCPYYEAFERILEKAPSKMMRFSTEIRDRPRIYNKYFQIVDMYFTAKMKKADIPTNALHLQIFPENKFYQLYQNWKQKQANTELFDRKNQTQVEINKLPFRNPLNLRKYFYEQNGQKFENNSIAETDQIRNSRQFLCQESNFCSEVQELIKNDQSNKPSVRQGYSLLHISEDQTAWAEVSEDQNFLHFHKQIRRQNLCKVVEDLKKWKHNSLVTSWYPEDQIIPFGKLFVKAPKKHEKIFQLKMNSYISNQIINTRYECLKNHKKEMVQSFETCDSFANTSMIASIICEPVENLSMEKSFFCCASISGEIEREEKKLDITYYFGWEKARKYFNSELNGSTNLMWESFVSFREQPKQKQSPGEKIGEDPIEQ